jgi:hypothetical protein
MVDIRSLKETGRARYNVRTSNGALLLSRLGDGGDSHGFEICTSTIVKYLCNQPMGKSRPHS